MSIVFYTTIPMVAGAREVKGRAVIFNLKRFNMSVITKKSHFLVLYIVLIYTSTSFSSFHLLALPNSTYTVPSNRYGHGMVFDNINERVLLFGGVVNTEGVSTWHSNETWSFTSDNNSWRLLSTITNPGLIAHHSMVYDFFHRKIICFGGLSEGSEVLNETWLFDCDTNEWIEVTPQISPPPRSDASMYYDSMNQKIVLFGGFGGESLYYLGDLWIYDVNDNTWTEMESNSRPPPSYGHCMVYDSSYDQGILFGGRTLSGVRNDLWIYNYGNNSWKLQEQLVKPDTRYWHTMVYDSGYHRLLVCGGRQNQYISSPVLNDTWSYYPNENMWIAYNTSFIPPSSTSRFVFDSVNQKAVLFGGVSSISPLIFVNGTWAYDCQQNDWLLITSPLISTSTSLTSAHITTETTNIVVGFSLLSIFPVIFLRKQTDD
ncbi:MAG: Kelch repeat-containing protein [Candidatus Hodarchaeales archaeon]